MSKQVFAVNKDGITVYNAGGGGEYAVAVTGPSDDSLSWIPSVKQQRANAILFAAAPALLRQLGKAYRELKAQGVDPRHPNMKAIRQTIHQAKAPKEKV